MKNVFSDLLSYLIGRSHHTFNEFINSFLNSKMPEDICQLGMKKAATNIVDGRYKNIYYIYTK